jgi:hypothetical protein
MKSFGKGFVAGAAVMLFLVFVVLVFRFFQERDRKIYEYVEVLNEIQELRKDYGNRDPAEFLDVPGVRGAADSAREEYYRRLNEILQRYGSEGID